MFGTILAVILTLLVVGGATGAAMYRVLDRSDTSSTSENGAVVEPIYSSPSPEPSEEATTQEPTQQRQTRDQPTEDPTTIVVVPRHTEEPTPFHHEEEPTPHDTPEQDEEFQTEEPSSTDSFGDPGA